MKNGKPSLGAQDPSIPCVWYHLHPPVKALQSLPRFFLPSYLWEPFQRLLHQPYYSSGLLISFLRLVYSWVFIFQTKLFEGTSYFFLVFIFFNLFQKHSMAWQTYSTLNFESLDLSLMQWYTSIIVELQEWRREDQEFKNIFSDTASSRLDQYTWGSLSKERERRKTKKIWLNSQVFNIPLIWHQCVI